MKKKFKLQDLDCANCAAKMESGIKKINGVKDASVSFMTQKMMIEAEEEEFFEDQDFEENPDDFEFDEYDDYDEDEEENMEFDFGEFFGQR